MKKTIVLAIILVIFLIGCSKGRVLEVGVEDSNGIKFDEKNKLTKEEDIQKLLKIIENSKVSSKKVKTAPDYIIHISNLEESTLETVMSIWFDGDFLIVSNSKDTKNKKINSEDTKTLKNLLHLKVTKKSNAITDYDNSIDKLKTEKRITEINANSFIDSINKKRDGYYYIGRNDCEYCQEFLPKLSKHMGTESINFSYLDSNKQKELQNENFEKIIDTLKLETVPALFKISNGKITTYDTDKDQLKSFIN
ncbi:hypothetical protein ACJYYY_01635 [Brochothrix campestris]|uniref:hypothetical protein n=1 Tax=Brochothrix campestris TaxID=2757 RepID=UPI0038D19941